MQSLKHRPEVDGLRAIAVVPVVLFHAGLGCPGGYVGVDVFFVISGYLITALIVQGIAAGQFTLVGFWERRLRRITPALVVMVLATLVAGWFLFLPDDLKRLGKSAVAQALLTANMHFCRNSGYFDGPTELFPLLHTWSLAVEEQFYLLLPIVFWSLRRCTASWLRLCIGALLLCSLVGSIYGAYWLPTATFYLLPTRAWELLLGSMIAITPLPQRLNQRRICEFFGGLGLLAILAAVVLYNRKTVFPGATAMLPCFGAAAVIWFNSPTLTLSGRALAARPCVFVGWISYSLYLWHWPVMVYARYWSAAAPSLLQQTALIGLSTVLAVLSWKLIETPFRRGEYLKSRGALFAASAASLTAVAGAGLFFELGRGLPQRLPATVIAYANGRHDRTFKIDLSLDQACRGKLIELGTKNATAPVELLIWGDSHAMALLSLFDQLCREQSLHAVAATHSATAPLVDYPCHATVSLRQDTVPYNAAILEYVRQHHIKHVLLAAKWSYYERTAGEDANALRNGREKLLAQLQQTIGALRDAGARVWIMKQVPQQDCDVPHELAKAAWTGDATRFAGITLATHQTRMACINAAIDHLAAKDVFVLDPAEIFMDPQGRCKLAAMGKSLYADDDHLSVHGSFELRPLLEPIVRQRPELAERLDREAGNRQ